MGSRFFIFAGAFLFFANAVYAAPLITPTTAFQHSAVALGEAATFSVTASGNGSLTYQWKKNGVDLPGQTGATLSFAAVRVEDEADYTVRVKDASGVTTSEPARLWVVPPTNRFVKGDYTDASGFRVPYFRILPVSYNPQEKYPLWILFHGAGDDDSTFVSGAGAQGFSRVAVSYGRQAVDPTIALYITRRAGAAGSGDWTGYVPVVEELITALQTSLRVDANRIYVIGYSAGGRPAVDLVARNPSNYAALMICNGTGSAATVSAIRGVPLWAVWSQADRVVTGMPAWVRDLRRAGGRVVFTEFQNASHVASIRMGLSLPPAVDWLFAQRRGVSPTSEPRIIISEPTREAVYQTTAASVSLAGTATALGHEVSGVSWENATTGAKGNATGTDAWHTGAIPLAADRSSQLIITATTGTSWAPAHGGSTSFNDALLATLPFAANISPQTPSSLLLKWTGGYPPFRVQTSHDLLTWTDLKINATSPFSLPTVGTRAFYRVLGQ